MSDSFEKIAEDALMDEYSYCEEMQHRLWRRR